MRSIKYVITQEGDHFVAQCLNVDVSSFGDSLDEAVRNIREAVELYFEDDANTPSPLEGEGGAKRRVRGSLGWLPSLLKQPLTPALSLKGRGRLPIFSEVTI